MCIADNMDSGVSEKTSMTGPMTSAEMLSLTDAVQHVKSARIEEACQHRDLDTLVELARSTGGLLTDKLRQQACMSSLPYQLGSCS